MRERLIGAIALVVIAAIMVPWLMSRAHHPRAPGNAFAVTATAGAPIVRIAPPVSAATPQTQALAGQIMQAAETASAPAVAVAVPNTVPSALQSLPQKSLPQKNVPQTDASTRTPAHPHSPASSGAARVGSAPTSTLPARAAPVHAAQTASAQASTPAPSAPAASPALGHGILAKGDWYVQVASFSSHTNAAQLAILLTRAGYHAFLATYRKGSTTFYRVRVGPYPSKDRAQAVAPGLSAMSGSQVFIRQASGSDG
jgi:DedD protein